MVWGDGTRSLQTELLPRREQGDRFVDALVSRLGPLRHVDPHDEVAPRPGRELSEEPPSLCVRPEGSRAVSRELWDLRTRGVAVRGGSASEAGRREQAGGLEIL